MRKALTAVAVLLAMGALMALTPVSTEFQMLRLLNGEEVRWVMTDGGRSGMYGTGLTCMPLAELPAAANGVVELVTNSPINLCERSTSLRDGRVWDGGCNTIAGDINFGLPVQPYIPKFIVLRSGTTHLCQATDGGTTVQTAAFAME